jgi:NAD(P)H-quinone oxidoreductase subunit 5
MSFLTLQLLLLACVPAVRVNLRIRTVRRLVTGLVGCEFLLALALAVAYLLGGREPFSLRLVDVLPEAGVGLGVYYDGATSLMLLLVAFVGLVVSQFSIRYLDGEGAQGRYFGWLGFTISAVSLMVVSGNLLLFFAAWVMTSLGLHRLLLHYRHRPGAQRAARTKFAISRLGDAFLLAALALTFRSFGTLDLPDLFARADELAAGSPPLARHAAIAWLLMLGAVTKSAQFPFHVWLPDTMETPTPVSALMHAGIVNAGGYLVIRLSPLFALAPAALSTLALVGTVTACFAGVVMMTQPSVKRALAYSTIAQMGFMMLQCGLGAFSAALLHIVAHSLYKAHAFLTSGSVLSQSQSTVGAASPTPNLRVTVAALLAAAAATLTAYVAMLWILGIPLNDKPGAFVLSFIFVLALTTWGWQLLRRGRRAATFIAWAGIAGLCLVYVASYVLVDHLLQPTTRFPAASMLVLIGIAAAFALLFSLHIALNWSVRLAWLAPLHVHAVNGFYVDAVYHRVFARLAKS